MPKLQKLLRSSFGHASIVASAVFIALSPFLLRSPLPHATPRFHADSFALLLIAMREVILVMPGVLAVSAGLAWWAMRKNLSSARPRVLTASVACLLMSAPFLVADFAIVNYSLAGIVEFTGVLIVFVTLLSIGTTGLVVLGKRNALVAAQVQPHVPNDAQDLGALASTF